MFLKSKIGLLKKVLFLCLFLIMGSFAATLNAAEKAKFIVNDDPFIFRNQKFIQGKKYTPQELQEKVGKAYEVADKAKLIEVIYSDEGLVFSLDRQNYFCGLEFFMMKDDKDPIIIYDLKIQLSDTYESIQKKIKALKITYNLYEQEGTNPIIDMEFISKKFGKVNVAIVCSQYEKQQVLLAAVLYMDIIHE
ncbi:hypothetical protein E4O05_07365 [Treponema sp. OMZ 787]|uniref:hypothetical protein n=1 Tax=Treponema sp. OMZ 787 TaxID=2563669 RepID=UPI0020A53060|nr:hypothetical protein [Treponema sp. OMZ 787]UTC61381.1 hypothetical protein E4O05_07365 [Treponema sp. OMZ 787]